MILNLLDGGSCFVAKVFDPNDEASRMNEHAGGDLDRFGAGSQESSLLALNKGVGGIKGECCDVFDLSFSEKRTNQANDGSDKHNSNCKGPLKYKVISDLACGNCFLRLLSKKIHFSSLHELTATTVKLSATKHGTK